MENKDGSFRIKRLGKGDIELAQKLFALIRDVFAAEHRTTASVSYLEGLLSNRRFIVYAALQNGEPAGGLTAYVLPMYAAEHAELFLYDIAVHARFRRRGVGTELLAALNTYCREEGIPQMFVAAHEEDEPAVQFYRSAGGSAEKVVHFTWVVEP